MTKYQYRRHYNGKRYLIALYYVNTLSKRFKSANELLMYITKLQCDFEPVRLSTCRRFVQSEYNKTVDEIYTIYENCGYSVYSYKKDEIHEKYISDFSKLVYYNVTNLTSDPIRCRFS